MARCFRFIGDSKIDLVIANQGSDNYSIILNCNSVGINDEIENNYSSVYPNPTNSLFSITGVDDNDNYLIEIFDISGRVLFKTQSLNNIDISKYPRGVYSYKLHGKNVFNGKIIKE